MIDSDLIDNHHEQTHELKKLTSEPSVGERNVGSPLPLTVNEKRVLEFIEAYVRLSGIAPTYQEIKDHFGFASLNSIQRYLKQLQNKNYISLPGDNQKRAIRILHSANSILQSLEQRSIGERWPSQQPNHPFVSTQLRTEALHTKAESLSLPLLGRVAAGAPIESLIHGDEIEVPSSMVRYPTKTFGLIVQGQSMIEDGILDGDILLVQKQAFAKNGDTVIAMIKDQATVKKIYLHKDSLFIHSNSQSFTQSENASQTSPPKLELRPANSSMQSMWFDPDEVDIQGIVVGLLRRY